MQQSVARSRATVVSAAMTSVPERDIQAAPKPMEAAWEILTSGRTLAWISGLVSMVLLGGLFVPQGASTGELLSIYPYALARSIQSLGLGSGVWDPAPGTGIPE